MGKDFLSSAMPALAQRLEEADAGRDRDVEAGHLAQHRDPQQEIAGLRGEVADAVALRAQHDGEGAGQLGLEKGLAGLVVAGARSEEHTSELQSHVSISYAVFCLKKIFFNDTATTEIYTLSLHDALPI